MNLGKIAILKPDHLGDLVLASPAIRVLSERLSNVTLLVNPSSESLAKFLFPEMDVQTIAFNHLSKFNKAEYRPPINGFDTIIALRQDPIITVEWLKSQGQNVYQVNHKADQHESEQQRVLISKFLGPYSPLDYFCARFNRSEVSPKAVGLCISCGHSSNSWPLVYWRSLALKFIKLGYKVFLIGGPQEADELGMLASLVGLNQSQIIVGSSDFGQFLNAVSQLEFVVATDSGAAHLCSLATRIYSIFGPSSYRKYAPLGIGNRVVSNDLNCSPCLQFAKDKINFCLSRECLTSITPESFTKQLSLDT